MISPKICSSTPNAQWAYFIWSTFPSRHRRQQHMLLPCLFNQTFSQNYKLTVCFLIIDNHLRRLQCTVTQMIHLNLIPSIISYVFSSSFVIQRSIFDYTTVYHLATQHINAMCMYYSRLYFVLLYAYIFNPGRCKLRLIFPSIAVAAAFKVKFV